MKIYLDIDGVLLTKKMEVPNFGQKFISEVITKYDCYWLTTHCRGGENKAPQYLSQFYSTDFIDLLNKVKETNWMDMKTEGIDFSSDFLWLDDNPFNVEKGVLRKMGKLDKLIVVDLNRKNELENILEKLENGG